MAQAKSTQTVESVTPTANSKDNVAMASLIVGFFNLCTWFLPLCGYPMTITGIVLGVIGLKSEKNKTMAIVGIVLSVLGLIATVINSALGVMMALNSYSNLN